MRRTTATPEPELPATVLLPDVEAAVEVDCIRAGAAWCHSQVAGLQFYDYGKEGLDGAPIRPVEGNRLNLVRSPSNLSDKYAVEVWWRNDKRIGHLPREVAAVVAKWMDQGHWLRAYVADGGNGRPWSAKVLLVGEPVRHYHDNRTGRAAAAARSIDEAGRRHAALAARRSA